MYLCMLEKCMLTFETVRKSHDIKQRQAAQTPYVVFVVASHYQSLQIVVLLLQACILGSVALSRTLLLQQLHRLEQDRQFRLFTSLFSCCLKTDSVASLLGKQ